MIPQPLILALILSSLLPAFLVNLYMLPTGAASALLYAVAVMYAGYRSTPLASALTGVLSVALYLITASLKGIPIQSQLVALVSLLTVAYLAVRMSRQRQEVARRAEETEAERRHLEASIVKTRHALAQPVTIIEGYARLLQKRLGGDEDGRDFRAVGSIQRSAQRIEAMIDEMRAVTRRDSDPPD